MQSPKCRCLCRIAGWKATPACRTASKFRKKLWERIVVSCAQSKPRPEHPPCRRETVAGRKRRKPSLPTRKTKAPIQFIPARTCPAYRHQMRQVSPASRRVNPTLNSSGTWGGHPQRRNAIFYHRQAVYNALHQFQTPSQQIDIHPARTDCQNERLRHQIHLQQNRCQPPRDNSRLRPKKQGCPVQAYLAS